jgi:short-subunit dehydrogenase
MWYKLDVKDNDSIEQTRDAVIDDFGTIDVIVNNAGKGLFGVFEASTVDQIKDQYETNLFGTMDVIKAFLPHLREKREGTIINITSMAGLEPNPLISLYNSSKFALDAFSEALSYELGQMGIRVKIVVPGSTKSDFMSPQSMVWTDNKELEDYQPTIEKFTAFAQKMTEPSVIMETVEVSKIIYEAATDGLSKVRYIVGKRNQQRFENRIANGIE